MRVSGHRGALRVAGRIAATLGKWQFERDPHADEIEVQAHIESADSFLMTKKPLEIELDALQKRRSVESVRIEDKTAFVIVRW